MGAVVLDASVLIGLLDAGDEHHERAVDEVERADRAQVRLLTAASAYSETLVAFARIGRVGVAREALAAMGITVVSLTAAVAERAAELRSEHTTLRLPDAMVLATAREHEATLLTYDRRLGRVAAGAAVSAPGAGSVAGPG